MDLSKYMFELLRAVWGRRIRVIGWSKRLRVEAGEALSRYRAELQSIKKIYRISAADLRRQIADLESLLISATEAKEDSIEQAKEKYYDARRRNTAERADLNQRVSTERDRILYEK